MIAAGFVGRQGAKSGSVGYEINKAPTLRQGITSDVVYSLQGNGIDRALTAGCNGAGWREQVGYTLNTIDRHGVAFAAGFSDAIGEKAQGGRNTVPDVVYQNTGIGWWNEAYVAETLRTPCGGDSTKANLVVYGCRGNGDGLHVPTLTGDHGNRVSDYTALCVGNGQLHQMSMAEQSNTLDCMHDQQAVLMEGKPPRKYIVRRLTPLECCRLQGFPDWWEDRVEGSDSARYKMWGNGIALPCAVDVLRRIAKTVKEGENDEQR